MEKVLITKNATLQKDGDDNFWLRLDVRSSGQSLAINLTSAMSDKISYEVDLESQNILNAFTAEQGASGISRN